MIIKRLYCWRATRSYLWKSEAFFGIMVISVLIAIGIMLLTYHGLGIFGPWYSDSAQVWYFSWLSSATSMVYFWGRYSRYSHLYHNHLMDDRGNMTKKTWWQNRSERKKDLEVQKLANRKIALGFADDLRKQFTMVQGHVIVVLHLIEDIIMKTLAMILIAMTLVGCDVTYTETTTEGEKTELGLTTTGQVGVKLNDVQCLNMATGQVEICLITLE